MVLIGATTENPSFEVNAALLSRCRVVVLKPLDEPQLVRGAARARSPTRSAGWPAAAGVDDDALAFLAARRRRRCAHGAERARAGGHHRGAGADGRRGRRRGHARGLRAQGAALRPRGRGALQPHQRAAQVGAQLRRRTPALYWLARMLEAGEDPLYVARRLVRFASEDVGLADPQALVQAMAAQQAVHFVGMPGGRPGPGPGSWSTWRPRPRATRSTPPTARRPPTRWTTRAEPGAAVDPQRAHGAHEGARLRQGLRVRPRRGGGRGRPWSACPTTCAGRRYYRPTDRGEEEALGERLQEARAPPGRGTERAALAAR